MISRVSRKLISQRGLARCGQLRNMGAVGPEQPEFGAQPPADKTLPFDNDLIWNDQTAPETIIDFDAPHVSTAQVFASIAAMATGLFTLYKYCEWVDPANSYEAVGTDWAAPPGTTMLNLGKTDYQYGDEDPNGVEIDEDDHGH